MSVYRYVGRGWLPGIPARDLTQVDLARLSPEQLATVAESDLYEPAGPDPRESEYQDELDLPSTGLEE